MLSGYLFAILAMFFWGLAPIFGKLGLTNLEPLTALTLRSGAVTVLLAIAVTVGGKWPTFAAAEPKDMLFVIMEGICAALLGQLAYYYALKYGEVSRISPFAAAFPLVTLVLAIAVLGEKLTIWKLMGSTLIIAGIIMLKF